MQTIEIPVSDLHAGLHEQLAEALGDNYLEQLRDDNEEKIHDVYQQVERAREQQEAQAIEAADADPTPVEENDE